MPELPEVEAFKQYFEATSLCQTVVDVKVEASQILDGVTPQDLTCLLTGKQFQKCQRHGKYLFTQADPHLWLVLHFGMTGSLQYLQTADPTPPYSRLQISFKNGCRLSFNDSRKFGKISLTSGLEDFVRAKHLGPDALQLDQLCFAEIAAGSHGAAKSALLDQHFIAGIGNIYADEILFQAGINPKAVLSRLPQQNQHTIYHCMRSVLELATSHQADYGAFPKSYLVQYRYKGARCPLDGAEIIIAKVAGRTTYYCSKHQIIF
jgi:formamidopyrimidine-DNA glycosylase